MNTRLSGRIFTSLIVLSLAACSEGAGLANDGDPAPGLDTGQDASEADAFVDAGADVLADTDVHADADVLADADVVVDADNDGSPAGEDCDDSDPSRHPEAVEVCDGVDNDCDEAVDEGVCVDGVDYCEGEVGLGGHPYRVNTDLVVNLLDHAQEGAWNRGDVTQAFRDALAAIPDETGGVLLVPPGWYSISDTILIARSAPVHIAGIGGSRKARGTRIEWLGPDDRPMFRVLGSSDSIIEGLLLVPGSEFVTAGIQVETREGRLPCRITFRNMVILSNNRLLALCGDEPCEDESAPTAVLAGLPYGFRFLAGDDAKCSGEVPGDEGGCAGPDRGNGLHFLQSCEVTGYGKAAFSFAQSSSQGNVLVHSHGYPAMIMTFPVSPLDALIDTSFFSNVPASGQGKGGSFSTYVTGTARNDQDVRLVASSAPIMIEGIDSEYSRRCLATEGGGESAPITFRFSRKAGSGATSAWVQPPPFEFGLDGELTVEGMLVNRDVGGPIVEATKGRVSVSGLDVYYGSEDCPESPWSIFDASEEVTTLAFGNAAQKSPFEGCSKGFESEGDPADDLVRGEVGPVLQIDTVDRGPNILGLMAAHEVPMVFAVNDFGAVPDDGLDDTLAFRAAVAALRESPVESGALVLGVGVYDISETILVEPFGSIQGGYFAMSGVSSERTVVQWSGGHDREVAAFEFTGLMSPSVTGFTVRPAPGHSLGTGIMSSTISFRNAQSSTHAYFDVVVDAAEGNLDYGFRIAPGDPPSPGENYFDSNGEWHLFQECEALGYNFAGFTIEHSQAKTMLYLNSHFDGRGRGEFGVSSVGWQARGLSGSFQWIGGGGGENRYADFQLGGANDYVSIHDARFAGSPRLLDDACGNSSNNHSLNIYNNQWASDTIERGWWQWPSDLNRCVEPSYRAPSPDEACIVKVGQAGPLSFRNNLVETTQPDAKLCMHGWPLGGNHIMSVINNDTNAVGSAASSWIYYGGGFDESRGVLGLLEVLNSARDDEGNITQQ